jgi:GNAT superfamily N-acetyltransferase
MSPHLILLPLLIYMDFGGNSTWDYTTEHCVALKSGALLRPCNRVYSQPGITAEEVAALKSFFGTVPFTWLVEKDDVASNTVLQEQGLRHLATFPAMSADITRVPCIAYAQEVSVREIESEFDLCAWLSIISQSYNYALPELSKAIRYFIDRGGRAVKLYLGLYEEKPVAASMLIQHGGVVSMHMVGTLPEYRGKGLGFAVTHAPLRDASAYGFTGALLLSSQAGESIYRRLGFKEYAVYHIYG